MQPQPLLLQLKSNGGLVGRWGGDLGLKVYRDGLEDKLSKEA